MAAIVAIVANPIMWLLVWLDLASSVADPASGISEPAVAPVVASLIAALLVAGVAAADLFGRMPQRLGPPALVAVCGAGLLGMVGTFALPLDGEGSPSRSIVLVVGVAVVWAVAVLPARYLPLVAVAPQLLILGVLARWQVAGAIGTAAVIAGMMLVGVVVRRTVARRVVACREVQPPVLRATNVRTGTPSWIPPVRWGPSGSIRAQMHVASGRDRR